VQGFVVTVIPPAWQATIGEERHFVAPHISERGCHLQIGGYCLRLSYPRDLKIRNIFSSGNMGTACISVWVGEGHEK
jgi:hypothetical protein